MYSLDLYACDGHKTYHDVLPKKNLCRRYIHIYIYIGTSIYLGFYRLPWAHAYFNIKAQ